MLCSLGTDCLPDGYTSKQVLFHASLQLHTCVAGLPQFALSIADYHPILLPSEATIKHTQDQTAETKIIAKFYKKNEPHNI